MEEIEKGKKEEFQIRDYDMIVKGQRMCVPEYGELKRDIMEEAHSSAYAMHPGSTKMYRLKLPPELSRIHDTFHVSMLRKYIPDPSHVLREQPV